MLTLLLNSAGFRLTGVLTARAKKRIEANAHRYIAARPELGEAIDRANRATGAAGVSLVDYALLHRAIMRSNARVVLECGTGRSTFVIAAALKRRGDAHLISMEESPDWYDTAKAAFPFQEFPFVEIRQSPAVEWCYGFMRGICYREVPPLPYGFVFVDGPRQDVDSGKAFDADFLRVLLHADAPVSALIDNRKPTTLAYSVILPGRTSFLPTGAGVIERAQRDHIAVGTKAAMMRNLWPRIVRINRTDPFHLKF